jgi:radical SAM enzyme (TIGR01210 family)
LERERRPGGAIEHSLTVFLAGAECPFTCSFCDLWRFTIDGPTPPGALPRQLRGVIEGTDTNGIQRLKLYNASNFFDTRAVPPGDLPEIAALAQPFQSVTVESHASTIGPRVRKFARSIAGRLEVAMGLETIHPAAATGINKRLELERFDRAAEFLLANGMDLRVFVLLGAPHVPVAESTEWTVRTVEYAVERGAAVVSIIPVRGGNGELERLQALGEFTPPRMVDIEDALDQCVHFTSAVITADLWDIGRLACCEHCRVRRTDRLTRLNLIGLQEPRVQCSECAS